jgi:hypothetical protein
MFENVRMISALRMAYVVFPTVAAAKMLHRVSISPLEVKCLEPKRILKP